MHRSVELVKESQKPVRGKASEQALILRRSEGLR